MWDAARIEPLVEFQLRAFISAGSDLRHSHPRADFMKGTLGTRRAYPTSVKHV